jgi:hypothetical protein
MPESVIYARLLEGGIQSMKAMSKFASLAFALSLASGTAVALTAAPAGAATINSCKSLAGTSTFKPPVTSTPKKGTITSVGKVTLCTPKAKTGGSGNFTSTLKSTKAGSCTTLVQGGNVLKGTAKTVWKNHKVTKMNITVKTGTGTKYNIATITGKVTSGLFAGHKITGQVKFTPKQGQDCVTTPLKQVTFKSTKPFQLH